MRAACASMIVLGCCLLLVPIAAAQDAPPAADRAALEKQFEERLSNCTLVGHFTLSGQPSDKLHEERYTIEKVTKDEGDYWVFLARIQYGEQNVRLPLKLEVKWAGDTPVITVTDMNIPLLGTYSARVVIHGDRYAGTWSGKNYGGHLFGKVVANDAPKPEAPKSGD
jgi:hypothetical protein